MSYEDSGQHHGGGYDVVSAVSACSYESEAVYLFSCVDIEKRLPYLYGDGDEKYYDYCGTEI